MMTPKWVLANINSLTRAELVDLVDDMSKSGIKVPDSVRTKPQMLEFIETHRRARREATFEASLLAKLDRPSLPIRDVRVFPGVLSASDCNQWLATLPPWPVFPERCQCPVCIEVRHG